jgi:hypothetical protein
MYKAEIKLQILSKETNEVLMEALFIAPKDKLELQKGKGVLKPAALGSKKLKSVENLYAIKNGQKYAIKYLRYKASNDDGIANNIKIGLTND